MPNPVSNMGGNSHSFSFNFSKIRKSLKSFILNKSIGNLLFKLLLSLFAISLLLFLTKYFVIKKSNFVISFPPMFFLIKVFFIIMPSSTQQILSLSLPISTTHELCIAKPNELMTDSK